jgi:DNA-binding transcriptional MerR regulator
MAKSPDAFRTISEVSDWLDTPAHVLRFWESKFTQIKPVKRAGGRRYYRPEDMALLGGIKTLLHEQGMTIKGVQKLLREQGIRHVAALGPQPLDAPGEEIEPEGGVAFLTAPKAAPPDPERPVPLADTPVTAAHAPDRVPASPLDAPLRPVLRRVLPDLPKEAEASPGFLSALLAQDPATLSRKGARLAPGLARLTSLRNRLSAAQ